MLDDSLLAREIDGGVAVEQFSEPGDLPVTRVTKLENTLSPSVGRRAELGALEAQGFDQIGLRGFAKSLVADQRPAYVAALYSVAFAGVALSCGETAIAVGVAPKVVAQ